MRVKGYEAHFRCEVCTGQTTDPVVVDGELRCARCSP